MGIGLALGLIAMGEGICFQGQGSSFTVYDSGIEFQEDQRDNDGGDQYAELSQQASGEATYKVRTGSYAQPGLSWVFLLGLSTQSSAVPGPAVSHHVASGIYEEHFKLGANIELVTLGEFTCSSYKQHWFHVDHSGASLSSL